MVPLTCQMRFEQCDDRDLHYCGMWDEIEGREVSVFLCMNCCVELSKVGL